MSLYQQVFQGESFSEQDYFEAVRYVLGPEYSNLGESELEDILLTRVNQMSESEAEGFWSSLGNVAKNIGSGVLKGVSAIAPIAGTAIGTYFGAPQIGSALGGLVGNLAGSAGTALSNVNIPNNSPNPRGRQTPIPNRRQPNVNNGGSQLRQTWQNTTNYLANAGRAALPAIQQYVQDNPVQLNPQTQQNVDRVQNLYGQLGGIINNPQFQAGQLQQTMGATSPNAPIENVSYAELVESLNYLTENILYEYYNNGLLPTEDYYVDDYGQFAATYSPERVNRMEGILAVI